MNEIDTIYVPQMLENVLSFNKEIVNIRNGKEEIISKTLQENNTQKGSVK